MKKEAARAKELQHRLAVAEAAAAGRAERSLADAQAKTASEDRRKLEAAEAEVRAMKLRMETLAQRAEEAAELRREVTAAQKDQAELKNIQARMYELESRAALANELEERAAMAESKMTETEAALRKAAEEAKGLELSAAQRQALADEMERKNRELEAAKLEMENAHKDLQKTRTRELALSALRRMANQSEALLMAAFRTWRIFTRNAEVAMLREQVERDRRAARKAAQRSETASKKQRAFATVTSVLRMLDNRLLAKGWRSWSQFLTNARVAEAQRQMKRMKVEEAYRKKEMAEMRREMKELRRTAAEAARASPRGDSDTSAADAAEIKQLRFMLEKSQAALAAARVDVKLCQTELKEVKAEKVRMRMEFQEERKRLLAEVEGERSSVAATVKAMTDEMAELRKERKAMQRRLAEKDRINKKVAEKVISLVHKVDETEDAVEAAEAKAAMAQKKAKLVKARAQAAIEAEASHAPIDGYAGRHHMRGHHGYPLDGSLRGSGGRATTFRPSAALLDTTDSAWSQDDTSVALRPTEPESEGGAESPSSPGADAIERIILRGSQPANRMGRPTRGKGERERRERSRSRSYSRTRDGRRGELRRAYGRSPGRRSASPARDRSSLRAGRTYPTATATEHSATRTDRVTGSPRVVYDSGRVGDVGWQAPHSATSRRDKSGRADRHGNGGHSSRHAHHGGSSRRREQRRRSRSRSRHGSR